MNIEQQAARMILDAFGNYLDQAHSMSSVDPLCKHGVYLAECYEDCELCFAEALLLWKLDEGKPLAEIIASLSS